MLPNNRDSFSNSRKKAENCMSARYFTRYAMCYLFTKLSVLHFLPCDPVQIVQTTKSLPYFMKMLLVAFSMT